MAVVGGAAEEDAADIKNKIVVIVKKPLSFFAASAECQKKKSLKKPGNKRACLSLTPDFEKTVPSFLRSNFN